MHSGSAFEPSVPCTRTRVGSFVLGCGQVACGHLSELKGMDSLQATVHRMGFLRVPEAQGWGGRDSIRKKLLTSETGLERGGGAW